jgi:oxalate decarboxylase
MTTLTDPGPRNPAIERLNPSTLSPPATDRGTLPNLKFPFANAHRRIQPGGWSREVTERELPAAKTLAAVNMRLEPGGIRELHWHKPAEWAFMLDGRARITAVSTGGDGFVDDVSTGDVWYFPSGIPHSIQGLAEGAEFLLVFDDPSFSENSTFSVTDWLAHVPRGVLARNFEVGEDAVGSPPKEERYIFPGSVPREEPAGVARHGPSFSHRFSRQEPAAFPKGSVRIVDSTNFPASTTVAAALVEVEPGGMRELHWHPTADEWQFYVEGEARMGVFASSGRARTFDYRAGDVGAVPLAMGHFVQNVGDGTLRFLEVFRSDRFADVSLAQWLGCTPGSLVRQHFQFDKELYAGLRTSKVPLV